MKKFILKIYIIVYKILYYLFCIKPVDNKCCVFCSMDANDTFGNLLLVKAELRHDFSCFSCMGTIKTLYDAARTAKKLASARFIFLNAAYTYTSIVRIRKGVQVIQLWHAAGAFKKFGMHSIQNISDTEIKKQKLMHGYYNYVVVSSDSVVGTYADAFQMNKEHVLPLGLPRIQRLIEQNKTLYNEYKNWLCNEYDQCWGKKIILYAPTFREINGKRDYSPKLNIEQFASHLPDDYILALRLHPRSKIALDTLPDNVINLTTLTQNFALICSDILITDYSSIVFDFSALNKPVLFYTPDEVMYNRGLYFSPRKKYPGITFMNFYDMANVIIYIYKNKDAYNKILAYSKQIKKEYVQNTTTAIDNVIDFVHTLSK